MGKSIMTKSMIAAVGVLGMSVFAAFPALAERGDRGVNPQYAQTGNHAGIVTAMMDGCNPMTQRNS